MSPTIITAPMTVTVSPEAGTFTMARGTWSASAPFACLPGWIKLYRHGRRRVQAVLRSGCAGAGEGAERTSALLAAADAAELSDVERGADI